jgi:hypothetical protein
LTSTKRHTAIERQVELQSPQHMNGVPVIELRNRPMLAELIEADDNCRDQQRQTGNSALA